MTTEVWEVSARDFPGTSSIELQLRFLLRYAILAPSARNTQPWRFEVLGDTVELFAAPQVVQPISDPRGREVYISLGCALENLLVAAEHFGFAHEVSYFPDRNPALVAKVRFRPGGARSPARADTTLSSIVRRHNDNDLFQPEPLTESARRRLQACRVEPELRLELTDDRFFHRWIDYLTTEADRAEFADPEFRKELAGWMGQGAFSTSRVLSRISALAISRLDLGEAVARQDHLLVTSTPLLGLISALGDDRLVQLKSGQLFERVWLTAVAMGLHVNPMSQTMRHPELRAAVEELMPETGWKPMHVFRVGYPREEGPAGHRTPRRPVGEAD
jgi:nitroreductase